MTDTPGDAMERAREITDAMLNEWDSKGSTIYSDRGVADRRIAAALTGAEAEARRAALTTIKKIPCWKSLSFETKDQIYRALAAAPPGDTP